MRIIEYQNWSRISISTFKLVNLFKMSQRNFEEKNQYFHVALFIGNLFCIEFLDEKFIEVPYPYAETSPPFHKMCLFNAMSE